MKKNASHTVLTGSLCWAKVWKKLRLLVVICTGFGGWGGIVSAQVVVYEDFVPPMEYVYLKERFFYAQIHTAGFTLGYEQGRMNGRVHYSGWNIEVATQLNPKAKGVSWYNGGRRYKFGMLNSFCILRAGYGGLWVLNEKPYWGGVQVSLSYRGGFSLGFAFPQYINVLYDTAGQDVRLERFEVVRHFWGREEHDGNRNREKNCLPGVSPSLLSVGRTVWKVPGKKKGKGYHLWN